MVQTDNVTRCPDGAEVHALASHHCSSGSTSGFDTRDSLWLPGLTCVFSPVPTREIMCISFVVI